MSNKRLTLRLSDIPIHLGKCKNDKTTILPFKGIK